MQALRESALRGGKGSDDVNSTQARAVIADDLAELAGRFKGRRFSGFDLGLALVAIADRVRADLDLGAVPLATKVEACANQVEPVTTREEREAFDRYVAAMAGAGGGEIPDAYVFARDVAGIARELMLERRKFFGAGS